MSRLLLLSSEFPPGPGGIGTHAHQLAAHMSQAGWQVRVLTFQDYTGQEEIAAFNRAQDFEVDRWLRPANRLMDTWARWRRLSKVLRFWEPDVLVASGDRQVWLAAGVQSFHRSVASARSSLPWCAIWHGSLPHHPLERQLSRWAFAQPDLTISVSCYSLEQLHAMGARPRGSQIITNGADEKRYIPDPAAGRRFRQQLGLEDALILLTVGHVSERKGQDIVIRALPEILKSLPDVHYLIAGLPTLRVPLEGLADGLGVSRHVHFLGRVDTNVLLAAYNACDVFVLTSRHGSDGTFEGYGIVVIEAALCGKPSVVADSSGLVEAIQDQRTGFVVPANDPGGTAEALKKLLQDEALRRGMGEQARRRALAEQTWQVSMDRYRQTLCRLADGDTGSQS